MFIITCTVLAVLLALFALMLASPGRLQAEANRNDAKRRAARHPSGSEPAHTVTFARALLTNPRAVGACCPSSARLARAVAAAVDPAAGGLVVELGGGTGVITAALLARGVPPERLVVVERDPLLARHLEKHFGALQVIAGDARELASLLERHGAGTRAATVVSSLPMISLSSDEVRAIGAEISAVLERGGVLVQYTYQVALSHARVPACLELVASSRVWLNLPPARVEVYRHRD